MPRANDSFIDVTLLNHLELVKTSTAVAEKQSLFGLTETQAMSDTQNAFMEMSLRDLEFFTRPILVSPNESQLVARNIHSRQELDFYNRLPADMLIEPLHAQPQDITLRAALDELLSLPSASLTYRATRTAYIPPMGRVNPTIFDRLCQELVVLAKQSKISLTSDSTVQQAKDLYSAIVHVENTMNILDRALAGLQQHINSMRAGARHEEFATLYMTLKGARDRYFAAASLENMNKDTTLSVLINTYNQALAPFQFPAQSKIPLCITKLISWIVSVMATLHLCKEETAQNYKETVTLGYLQQGLFGSIKDPKTAAVPSDDVMPPATPGALP